MKIPTKKEKPEQPVTVLRITRLPACYELTKSNQEEALKVVMKNNVYIQALQDLELEVLLDGGIRP
jgi:hypothetical protein